MIKHGIIGLTIATYWPKKVRCNAIAFGGMENKQNKNFMKRLKTYLWEEWEKMNTIM